MRSEIRDGFYTGRPDGPFTYREGKAVAIREVAGREGIDLSESRPTPTRSPTSRCCAPSATRWP